MTHPLTRVGRFDSTTGVWRVTGAQAERLPQGCGVVPYRKSDGTAVTDMLGIRLRDVDGWYVVGGSTGELKKDWTYRVVWPPPFPSAGGVVAPVTHGGQEVG